MRSLETKRLLLGAFVPADAPRVAAICNDFELHRGTTLPFPYALSDAEAFIAKAEESERAGTEYVFAMRCKDDNALVGAISARMHPEDRVASLGYWIARGEWGKGLATEAARALVRWIFENFGIDAVKGEHYAYNLASGRVLQKIGFKQVRVLPNEVFQDGVHHDMVVYELKRG